MSDEADKKRVGSYYIADTNLHTFRALGFFTVTATTIAVITFPSGYEGPSADEGAVITAVALPAGHYYPIPFDSIDLTSGSIIAYRK